MADRIIASGDARPIPQMGESPAENLIRTELARVACYEIQLLARAAQRYIESEDEGDKISPVTRGMLLRISDLSDAISGARDTDQPIAEVEDRVYGKAYQR